MASSTGYPIPSEDDLPKDSKVIWVVQSLIEKYSPFTPDPNHIHIARIPAHTKGRFAIVTNVGQGMRWTRKHAAQTFCADERR
jgi:hypothetical protein